MDRFNKVQLGVLLLSLMALSGCQGLVPHDTQSLLIPRFHRSEVFGFVAGFGTTFAAVPDLVAMLRRRSSAGMNPRMAAIIGVFQILWGLLRSVDCFATGDHMEYCRGLDQFPERRSVPSFRPQRNKPCHPMIAFVQKLDTKSCQNCPLAGSCRIVCARSPLRLIMR